MAKHKDPEPRTVTRALEFECFAPGTLRLDEIDLKEKVDDETYEAELATLEKDILKRQIDLYLARRRAIFLFEGWDAAGKGGAIKRLTAPMDARGFRVWPISAPRDEDARNHYLWRFWRRLPLKGEVAIFDRSWYGRVLVERVEGFAKKKEWKRAYDEINAFEKMLTDDGVVIRKFFLHIDRKTQLERFKAREGDPLKQYKLGEEDWRNRKRWADYEAAIHDMFDFTHRPDAPWQVIPSNNKKLSRITVLRHCAEALQP